MIYLKRIQEKADRFKEVQNLLQDPLIGNDPNKMRDLGKEFRVLEPFSLLLTRFNANQEGLRHARTMIQDKNESSEMQELARMELEELEEQEKTFEKEAEKLLIKGDPSFTKNCILEIRAGTGGLEAGLFAADLLRLYTKYAQANGFKLETLSLTANDAGGMKEVIMAVNGDGAYGRFKYESGTHRVQRVPATEASGRIHTSAATVAVLPEAEEVEVDIRPEDLRIDVFRSGGPGGQSVNTTDSAVRVTHVPSGLVVSCQDEKSQLKNKQKALKVLRARLYEKIQTEQNEKIAKQRKQQVGSGDRSEKIRTYNFPDGRVTDHRIGLTVHNIEAVMNGEIEAFVDALYQAEISGQTA